MLAISSMTMPPAPTATNGPTRTPAGTSRTRGRRPRSPPPSRRRRCRPARPGSAGPRASSSAAPSPGSPCRERPPSSRASCRCGRASRASPGSRTRARRSARSCRRSRTPAAPCPQWTVTGRRTRRIGSVSSVVPDGSSQLGCTPPKRAIKAGEMQGVVSSGRPDASARSFGPATAASAKNLVRPGFDFSRLPQESAAAPTSGRPARSARPRGARGRRSRSSPGARARCAPVHRQREHGGQGAGEASGSNVRHERLRDRMGSAGR